MTIYSISHRGAVREQNQDACRFVVLSPTSAIAVVCDGMGGALSGDVASKMAVDLFVDTFQSASLDLPLEKRLEHAVVAANEGVFHRATTDDMCTGMGTTLVATYLEGESATLVNVGDSRAYHISHEQITQITRDHSVVADLIAEGTLTLEEAKNYPYRNLITRALGAESNLRIDYFHQSLQSGEYLLLCSDGLSNMLTNEELRDQVLSGGIDEQCCGRLLEIALERGARDNVTAMLICK